MRKETEKFFKEHGQIKMLMKTDVHSCGKIVTLSEPKFTIEELYQAFKDRYICEQIEKRKKIDKVYSMSNGDILCPDYLFDIERVLDDNPT